MYLLIFMIIFPSSFIPNCSIWFGILIHVNNYVIWNLLQHTDITIKNDFFLDEHPNRLQTDHNCLRMQKSNLIFLYGSLIHLYAKINFSIQIA